MNHNAMHLDPTVIVANSLDRAVAYHQAGNLHLAEQIYRQILQADADHVDALHLLGLVELQAGNFDTAIGHIRKALLRRPDFPEAHFNLGIALHQQGSLSEATTSWRQAVRYKPDYAEAHNCLAAALREQGQVGPAVTGWREAIRWKPDYAEAHHSLASALMEQGKLAEAVGVYQQLVLLEPTAFRALNNLGFALIALGRPEEAIGWLREAIRLRPEYAQAHNNLGNALAAQGQRDAALASYRRVLAVDPNFAAAYNNVGKILLEQRRLEEAAANFREALRIQPDFIEALNNLGNVYLEQENYSEAVFNYRQVLRLNPGYSATLNNLGKVFLELDKLDDASAILQQALHVRPDFAEGYNNLALIRQEQGKIPETVSCFQEALRIDPQYVDAHKNLGMALLLAGDWQRGWVEYEWRLRAADAALPKFDQPSWDGTSPAGRTVLLHTEQGFGDTLQFVRFVDRLKKLGARVLLRCQRGLAPLLSRLPSVERVIAEGDSLPAFDVHAPLMSLPKILALPISAVSAAVPYLFTDPELVELWRQKIAMLPTMNVGIGWQGNPKYRRDRLRSIPLAQFAPLASVEGVQLISLQKGFGAEQLSGSAAQMRVARLEGPIDESAGPFMDTTAIMQSLDLVITSDCALAHLAGGLGVPVWLALPFAPDWRWMLDREDSPWYPTMRLFRQAEPGNWQAVFTRMATELRRQVRN